MQKCAELGGNRRAPAFEGKGGRLLLATRERKGLYDVCGVLFFERRGRKERAIRRISRIVSDKSRQVVLYNRA